MDRLLRRSNGKGVAIAVIPAHNECQFISNVIDEAHMYVDKVIVVDDGSTDYTLEKAAERGAVVYKNERRMGKWAALNRGFLMAIDEGADVVITLDGDGQHDPKEIPKLLHLLSNGTDVALGARKFGNRMPLIRRMSNRLTTLIINSLFSMQVSDSQCGFRAYNKGALTALSVSSAGFEGETESLITLGNAGFQINEVPIKTIYRKEVSEMNVLRDSWRFVRVIAKLKMRNLPD